MRLWSDFKIGALLCTIVLLLLSSVASAGISARKVADMNKPGTVMIQTNYTATITVPEPVYSEERLNVLVQYVYSLVEDGTIPPEEKAVLDTYFSLLLSNPLDYIVPTRRKITRDVACSSTGTGFVVTADGYVVTNAHVVSDDEEALWQQMVLQGMEELMRTDVAEFVTYLEGLGFEPYDTILDEFTTAMLTYYLTYMEVSRLQKDIFVILGAPSSGSGTVYEGIMVVIGESSPGKDVAVLKIGGTNHPALLLGSGRKLRTGDPLYVLGYPALATFHPFLDETSYYEPTLTSGVVSARRTMPGGWQILQTDASIAHGNSGGPVLDGDGHVVGIATFGTIDPASGSIVQGLGFVIPVEVIRPFLTDASVSPKEDPLMQSYFQGLTFLEQGDYRKALDQFIYIRGQNGLFPYIEDYISAAESSLEGSPNNNSQGADDGLPDNVYLLLAVLFALMYLLGRKKEKTDNKQK